MTAEEARIEIIRGKWNWENLITDIMVEGNKRGKMTLRSEDWATRILGSIGEPSRFGKKDIILNIVCLR